MATRPATQYQPTPPALDSIRINLARVYEWMNEDTGGRMLLREFVADDAEPDAPLTDFFAPTSASLYAGNMSVETGLTFDDDSVMTDVAPFELDELPDSDAEDPRADAWGMGYAAAIPQWVLREVQQDGNAWFYRQSSVCAA